MLSLALRLSFSVLLCALLIMMALSVSSAIAMALSVLWQQSASVIIGFDVKVIMSMSTIEVFGHEPV